MRFHTRKAMLVPFVVVLAVGVLVGGIPGAYGADHGDAPNASNDAAGDLNDIYAFLDPNDNGQIVVVVTLRGFIPAGENANFGNFDHRILTAIELETTGDAVADAFLAVTFSPQTARTAPQTATITAVLLPSGAQFPLFTAPTTISSAAPTPPAQTITTDAATGIRFFAGMTDDPFFFDIPAFGRFVASVLGGTPDPSQLTRGRDSFAGYNTMAIVVSLPRSLFGGATSLGIGARSFRVSGTLGQPGFTVIEQLDREGVPAVNVALTPFASKNAYNLASPPQDAAGQFATGIVGTLTALGTNSTNIATLASVAVNNGDLLRLDLTVPNTGTGGGTNAPAAFPNGRRLGDDVVDTLLNIITNGVVTTGDSVNANERPFQDTFPFLALPHQPLASGVDDDTRN
jgi:uncharacterized protein DUF4331